MKTKKFEYLMVFIFGIVFSFQGFAQEKTINGTISDDQGFPLPGVTVIIKGTTMGTASDVDGNYSLKNVPADAVLTFSFVGMKTKELAVTNETNFNVVMETDAIGLEEVVAIGYGVTKKRDLVSSVTSVDSEVLENQPTPRIDQAMQGRAAGVSVTSTSGAPGAAATVRIRGTNSVKGNNSPLYVIDGFIAGSDFDLNTLNVNDVKSIEVLKDATALSIYGTRGAAGVILITTKSGKRISGGKPNISFNHYTTVQTIANNYEVLTGQDYLDYMNEASQFIPGPNGFGYTDTSLPLEFPAGGNYANTDWIGLVKQNGVINNTDVSVSGGSNNMNYYVSFNRFDQKGVIKNSGLERYSLRVNLDMDISDKVRSGIRMSIADINQENNKVEWDQTVNRLLSIRPVYNEDGTYNGINPKSGREERNPVADINLRQDNRNTKKFVGNSYLEYEPISGLRLKSTVGTSLTDFRENQYLPGELPERMVYQLGGSATVTQNRYRSILNENTITFSKELNDHRITALAGATWQKDVAETSGMSASGFVNDAVGYNNISLGSEQSTYIMNTGYVQRTFASLLARLDYSYRGKYLVTLVGRRDGSSVFEEGNKYAFFPSLGLAWNLHEEDFMKSVDAISSLKLRTSYGIVGDQGVSPYNSLATFTGTYNYFNQNLFNAIIIGDLPSSNLSWETTKQFDLGMDLALLNGRINVEADFYKKNTTDLLLERKVPGTVGNNQLQNIGEIENKGIDLNIRTMNVSKPDFFWETTLVLSANRNKVVDLGGVDWIQLDEAVDASANGGYMRLIVGETVPTFYGVTYLGTYKNQEEIIADGWEGKGFIGGPRFDDVNNDGELTEADRKVLGSPEPDFQGGLRNVLSYKGFTFDMFFQFTYGNEILNRSRETSLFGKNEFNLSTEVRNRWIEGVNESSDIPRAGTSQGAFFPPSSIWVEDASFLRLKQVTVSYDLPTSKIGFEKVIKSANIYLTGNNLFLLSNFSQGDPEVSYLGTESLAQGLYYGQYPYTRSFVAGIKLNF
ncbi:TonB-linked outer membrane protein, SusC/RagA family [Mariniphaga anaerophila]|uniref:TonB-linked outer membrane protein, SusC/RagA family n=1 Tax=Mariniphaga anaerophila TaxID=1484053 RepID=A0A1M4Y4K1_9BACT|nr:TonB-dependent receptor [Mariniphaga anaerophila]SHF00402.1 TonB-linked outer membrane protein, SusC/RagA family [Mariniphaga anaerophila]